MGYVACSLLTEYLEKVWTYTEELYEDFNEVLTSICQQIGCLLDLAIDEEPDHPELVALDVDPVDQLGYVLHLVVIDLFHRLQGVLNLPVLLDVRVHVVERLANC